MGTAFRIINHDDFRTRLSHHFVLQHMKYPCHKCGHKMVILPSKVSTICDWCGHKIFKTKKEWFDYNLLESIKKGKKDERNKNV